MSTLASLADARLLVVFADVAGTVSLGLSAASLVAVVLIGLRTIKVTEQATAATERSTKATEANLAVAEQTAQATERATEATKRSVAASEQVVQAATYANALMKHDARVQRIQAILDVAAEMRRVWNEDYFKNLDTKARMNLNIGTPEHQRRLYLCLLLEARLASLEEDELPKARAIGRSVDWAGNDIEDIIFEGSQLLKQEMASLH